MRSRLVASALLLQGFAAACASSPQASEDARAEAASEVVVSVHAADGTVLVGAAVAIASHPEEHFYGRRSSSADVVPWTHAGTSDAAGDARVEIGRGPFRVRVDHAGYVPELLEFGMFNRVAVGDEPTEAVLQPAARIEGRVIDAASGEAVAGARVTCQPTKMTPWELRGIDLLGETTSDATGRFVIDTAVPRKWVVLRAEAPGFARAHADVRTPDAVATTTVEIRIDRPVALSGFVRDATGAPVRGATVWAVARDPRLVDWEIARWPWPCWSISDTDAEFKTGDDGAFRLDGLSANATYVVYAIEYDRNRSDSRIRVFSALRTGVKPAAGASVDLVVAPYPRAFVRLVDASGAPLPRREIAAAVDGHSQYRSWSDADGWAQVAPELGGLRRGRVHVRLLAGAASPIEVDVDMSDGKDARAEVVIPTR